jgi:RHS repeat-associated protein
MTNVTIATESGAQVEVNGTRVLSYAFDDTRAGAQSVNGTTVGNGNLEYTVSLDVVTGKHTVRSETYTSFNMPNQIVYGNFVSSTSSTADRTLTFVYGPEHQRVKQTVQLSGSGTSSYKAGTTWYMNGIDSLGLSYEKEVQDNGTTEHKHYVGVGADTFAIFVSRTGNLNGNPATTTSYLHKDHLGSVAAITNEAGTTVERLAYDPWGKRRQTNGTNDTADSIVGQKTERGYTMHEHLDEVGVIHMNARIYDPLIGQFMSADDVIPDPTNLKAFNRYSYVYNNPLRGIDPTGHEIDDMNLGASGTDGLGGGGDAAPSPAPENDAWKDKVGHRNLDGSGCLTCDWFATYVNVDDGPGAHAPSGTAKTTTGTEDSKDSNSISPANGNGADVNITGRIRVTVEPGDGANLGRVTSNYTTNTNAISNFGALPDGGFLLAVNTSGSVSPGPSGNLAPSWGRPETLQDHFERHGKDVGAKNAQDYAAKAQEFRDAALKNPNAEFRIDSKGVLRIYDPATNTFAAYNANDTTRTFYKPTNGVAYWTNITRDLSWGQRIDTTPRGNLTTPGQIIRVIRILGRNLE